MAVLKVYLVSKQSLNRSMITKNIHQYQNNLSTDLWLYLTGEKIKEIYKIPNSNLTHQIFGF